MVGRVCSFAAVLAVTTASATSAGPIFKRAFSADLETSSTIGTGTGKIYYNGVKQEVRTDICTPVEIFRKGDQMCTSSLAKNLTTNPMGHNSNISVGKGNDQVCKAMPGPYYDPLFLDILAMSIHKGSKVVGGEPCEIWEAELMQYHLKVATCLASDGVPREHNVTTGLAYKAAAKTSFRFSNVIASPPDSSRFAPLEICEKMPQQPNCDDGTEVNLDLYRLRSTSEPNVLANRNLGDAYGDLAFFCTLNKDVTSVVTHWKVKANSSWGQYGYCLYVNKQNVCYGGSKTHIGREASEGFGDGPRQGQCSPNAKIGSWFSVPGNTECKKGAQIGDNGCTWMATPVRTVSAACILNDRGLSKQCAEEIGHAPFTKSADIFKKALASDDPSKGGCPDVHAEGADQIVV